MAACRHEEPDRVPIYLQPSGTLRLPGVSRRLPLEKQIEAVRNFGGDPLVDIWMPPEMPGPGQEDMALLKRESGDRITLWGGLDTTYTVTRGTIEQIEAAVKEAIKICICAPGGGFVILPTAWVMDDALWMVAGNNMESDVWKLVRT